MTTSDAAKKKAAAAAEDAKAKQPASEEVASATPVVDEQAGDPTERRDPPADDPGPEVDSASGALVTGEDAQGRPLTTEDIAGGAEPVAPGTFKERVRNDDDADGDAKEPEVATDVSWNGMTATDTVNGEQVSRPATLAEQLPKHADELLRLVVGSVPYATSGSISLNGETITITLVSH